MVGGGGGGEGVEDYFFYLFFYLGLSARLRITTLTHFLS